MKGKIRIIYFFLRKVFLSLIPAGELFFNPAQVKNILFIRIDRIGDVVCSLPAIKLLKENFPSAKISLLVKRENASLLKMQPYIDEVLIWRGFTNYRLPITDYRFDLAVDLLMDYHLKMAFICWLTRAKYRLGFDIAGRGVFFNLRVPVSSSVAAGFSLRDEEKKHMVEHTLNLIMKIANCKLQNENWKSEKLIYVSEEKREKIRGWLKEKGVSEEDCLVEMHPGGHYPSQRWPAERFGELARRLLQIENCKLQNEKLKMVVIGTKQEENLLLTIRQICLSQSAIRNPQSAIQTVVGWPLDEVAALIEQADLFIGNNSGPLHLAWAVGTPSVSTLGPTVPWLWEPYQGKREKVKGKREEGEEEGEIREKERGSRRLQPARHIVIRKELACSPCSKGRCRTHECLRQITVEEMFEAAEKLLNVKCLPAAAVGEVMVGEMFNEKN